MSRKACGVGISRLQQFLLVQSTQLGNLFTDRFEQKPSIISNSLITSISIQICPACFSTFKLLWPLLDWHHGFLQQLSLQWASLLVLLVCPRLRRCRQGIDWRPWAAVISCLGVLIVDSCFWRNQDIKLGSVSHPMPRSRLVVQSSRHRSL